MNNNIQKTEEGFEVEHTDREQEVWADIQTSELSVQHDLQEQIEKIRERNVEPLAEMLVDDLMEKVDPVQAIETDMGLQIMVDAAEAGRLTIPIEGKPFPDTDVYSSLEEILQHLIDADYRDQVIEKLQRTIQSGAYINNRPTE